MSPIIRMFATQKQSLFHNKGIQTYVALIGTDKYNFISEFYQCVTEANDDVVIIDPVSPSYTTLTINCVKIMDMMFKLLK